MSSRAGAGMRPEDVEDVTVGRYDLARRILDPGFVGRAAHEASGPERLKHSPVSVERSRDRQRPDRYGTSPGDTPRPSCRIPIGGARPYGDAGEARRLRRASDERPMERRRRADEEADGAATSPDSRTHRLAHTTDMRSIEACIAVPSAACYEPGSIRVATPGPHRPTRVAWVPTEDCHGVIAGG